MATNTTNYGWTKPSYEDAADIEVINGTIDNIDEQVKTNENNISKDEAALVEIVDGGAKNLMKNTAVSQSVNGVEFTVNSDGTVTANGTATANAIFYLTNLQSLSNGLILSGTPSTGSIASFCMQVRTDAQNVLMNEYGGGATIANTDQMRTYRFCIRIANGYTADNLIFKPMLCTKAAWDISQTYQPYRPSYQELYDMVKDMQANQ